MNTGSFTEKDRNQLLRESDMMLKFDHPHVINLIGICLDAGPSPYLVLPFMENGSLLSYIKKNRCDLLVTKETDEDKVAFNSVYYSKKNYTSSDYGLFFNQGLHRSKKIR